MMVFALKGRRAFAKCALGLMVWSLLLCWPETVSAQSPELKQVYQQGQALTNNKQFKEATPFYQLARPV